MNANVNQTIIDQKKTTDWVMLVTIVSVVLLSLIFIVLTVMLWYSTAATPVSSSTPISSLCMEMSSFYLYTSPGGVAFLRASESSTLGTRVNPDKQYLRLCKNNTHGDSLGLYLWEGINDPYDNEWSTNVNNPDSSRYKATNDGQPFAYLYSVSTVDDTSLKPVWTYTKTFSPTQKASLFSFENVTSITIGGNTYTKEAFLGYIF